ncbi:hypothetical protein DSO57_1025332 [Entomophthora muscae]|uniref:Uncharacterized protein n=1 Tax=Entomophthora muscae TaxID=34485 RepID=A0ACC2SF82_9FUNG|nr:hypothetical protein DSO57_1025332 [Entomophthora muscae]
MSPRESSVCSNTRRTLQHQVTHLMASLAKFTATKKEERTNSDQGSREDQGEQKANGEVTDQGEKLG